MRTTDDSNNAAPVAQEPSNVVLFTRCDPRDALMSALLQPQSGSVTRADALLFGWMLGLEAGVDPVAAAKAIIHVEGVSGCRPRSRHQIDLVQGLQRFIKQRGRVAALSARSLVKVRNQAARTASRTTAACAGEFTVCPEKLC
ncbi:MAG: hypothetical protein V3U76_02280 [Granulosicoccus sp.]